MYVPVNLFPPGLSVMFSRMTAVPVRLPLLSKVHDGCFNLYVFLPVCVQT